VSSKIDFNPIKRAAIQAFKKTARLYAEECQKVISDPQAFPDYPGRDIVDSGKLRDSQRLAFFQDRLALLTWDAPYSLFVYLGYTTRNGTRPGRPWGKVASDRLNPQETYDQLLAQELDKISPH